MNHRGNITTKIFITGFLVLISLPLTVQLFAIRAEQTISENRRIKSMPSLEITFSSSLNFKGMTKSTYNSCVRFIRKFDDYYRDTFGFRADLLRFYINLKLTFFHTEPLPKKVVRGSNGWFFLGDSYSNVIKESKGIENFSKDELSTCLQNILEKQAWLHARKIQFYLAVAPNKLSVYGNHLPIRISKKQTQVKQIEALSSNNFNFIDLKNHFELPPEIRLYHKTDSHWNDYGAYLGYTALMEKVKSNFAEIPILPQTDFLIDTVISYRQDLTNMLSLRVRENVIRFTPKRAGKAHLQASQLPVPKNYDRAPRDYEKRYKSDVNHLKVLVFHDSFTTSLIQYIKESFGETVFIWKPHFNKDLVEQEKPDIVLQIIVERNLELLNVE